MVMAENEAGDDQRDLNGNGGAPKSPWKTPFTVDAKAAEDAPVMGAESWPALAEAHIPKNSDAAAKQPALGLSPLPAQVNCQLLNI